ncbi:MAG: recombinase RecX [Saprospiraceae bacterium]|nr:MAG: recombinase RecX [Saprospiraceae bacterium]
MNPPERKSKKYYSTQEALLALQRYCAYQDRCHQEVRSKLLSMGIYGDDLEQIIVHLIEDKFLDEERFARSYARGKFRIKKWGRLRIVQELKKRQVSAYCIRKALEEIDPTEYEATLTEVLRGKMATATGDDFTRRQKALQYAMRKGYEIELAREAIEKL